MHRNIRITVLKEVYAQAEKQVGPLEAHLIKYVKRLAMQKRPAMVHGGDVVADDIYLNYAERAGLETPEDFRNLSDSEILRVSGFGSITLKKIREEYPYDG